MAPPPALGQGEAAWLLDEGMYVPVTVVESAEGEGAVTVQHADGSTSQAQLKRLSLAEPSWPKGGHDDNTMLTTLNEANLLENLRLRFAADSIYTYTGSILMAMNPYKQLPLYGDAMIEQYRGRPRGSNPPHVYAMADRVHRALAADRVDQSIIVSGESGAGKTETCKAIMKFLLTVRGVDGAGSSLDAQILDSNPILEAFGNARTLRNNNSSRFGKFIKVHFDAEGQVSGASIVTYLLEKSRLVAPAANERCYHCFYQLLAGASPEERDSLALPSLSDFGALARTGCTAIEGVDDAADLAVLRSALCTVGMPAEQQTTVFQVLSAILWLTQTDYIADDGDDETSTPSNPESLETAAKLLGVNDVALEKALCSRCVVGGRGSVYYRPRTVGEATTCTEALIKALYGRMFDWIVTVINGRISGPEATSCISVLDIYGFESYEHNSLEQLCINYANEKLQRFFVHNVLAHEQEAYCVDGVHCSEVTFDDNQPTVELIEQSPSGIFGILDEVCRLPQPNDSAFTDKVHAQHENHASLSAPRVSRKCKISKSEGFVVQHFAGKVLYSSEGFVSKNMDKLHEDVERLIGSSTIELVSSWQTKEDANVSSGKGRKRMSRTTVVSRFSSQLTGLLEDLGNASANYIRCIKPTDTQQAGTFDCSYVLNQVRNNGTNEALQLMHEGFPTRCAFAEFANRYRDKMPHALQSLDPKSLCEALLSAIGVDKKDYAIGVTQVWFKAGRLAFMDEVFRAPIDEIVGKVRKWLARHRFWKAGVQVKGALRVVQYWRQLRAQSMLAKTVRIIILVNSTLTKLSYEVKKRSAAAVMVQSFSRMSMRRREYIQLQAAAGVVQRSARTATQRRSYIALRACSVLVQHAWKAHVGRANSAARAQKRTTAAVAVQATWRGHLGRQCYNQLLKSRAVEEEAAALAKAAEEEAARIAAEEEAAALAKAAEEEAARIAAEEEAAALAKAAEEEAARIAAEEEAAALAKAAEEEAARIAAEEEAAALAKAAEEEAARIAAEEEAAALAKAAEEEAARIAAEEEAAALAKAAEEEAARIAAEEEAAALAKAAEEEAARIAAEEEAAALAKAAEEEAARIAAEEEAAALAKAAEEEAARIAAEEEAAALAKAAEEEAARIAADEEDMTVNLSSLSQLGERSESVADMLPKLEEEMQQVEALCNEIAEESSRPVCAESVCTEDSETTVQSDSMGAVAFNAPSSAEPGRRLSAGAPLLLDRLTSEDDKAIQDFLELNYEMTETIQSIDSLLPSDSDHKPAPASDIGTGNLSSRRSTSSSNQVAGSRLPMRRDSGNAASKLPVPKRGTSSRLRKTASSSSTANPVPTRTLSEGRSVNRRLSELPGPKRQTKPQQKAKKFMATIGERVETPCGVGTVLFRGKTDFADGEWVGVELDEAGGKHDGEVAGKRYFSTAAGCGLFVRATSLQA